MKLIEVKPEQTLPDDLEVHFIGDEVVSITFYASDERFYRVYVRNGALGLAYEPEGDDSGSPIDAPNEQGTNVADSQLKKVVG